MNFSAYSAEQLQAARAYAASIEQNLIASLQSGETQCRDPQSWIAELEAAVKDILSGASDSNFTIRQRMHYFLTGECVLVVPRTVV